MKNHILIFLVLISQALFSKNFEVHKIKTLTVDSSINPAIYNYISNEIDKSEQSKNEIILIKLDTPGGLVSTTKDILTKIGDANFPIVVWITPEGASATSAGAIIASAAHVLVMSEGTNIGAATPITMNGDIGKKTKDNTSSTDKKEKNKDSTNTNSDARAKAINDLVALVTSLSKSRGRNSDAFSKMISKAASYDSQQAKDKNIIDSVISSKVSLINFLQNRKVKVKGQVVALNIKEGFESSEVSLDPGQALLNIFANPTTAYMLFIIGAALLYFEFQAPGGFIAGSLGAVSLILSGIGFQVLPLNFGAFGLILLAFILFIIEIYVTSYGILTLGGICSLVFGSLFLFRTENAYLDIELPVILSVVAAVGLYVLLIGYVFLKMKRKKGEKFLSQTGEFGKVSKFDKEEDGYFFYRIKINGEIWSAKSSTQRQVGEKVEVEKQSENEMILILK